MFFDVTYRSTICCYARNGEHQEEGDDDFYGERLPIWSNGQGTKVSFRGDVKHDSQSTTRKDRSNQLRYYIQWNLQIMEHYYICDDSNCIVKKKISSIRV